MGIQKHYLPSQQKLVCVFASKEALELNSGLPLAIAALLPGLRNNRILPEAARISRLNQEAERPALHKL